jgi:hypothetical protein
MKQITRITSKTITATPAPADATITICCFFSFDSARLIAKNKEQNIQMSCFQISDDLFN